MNTRAFATVSQSPSPAPLQWSEDVCRSSSAPPQIGAAGTDPAERAALAVPGRPKSCGGDLPAQPALIPLDGAAPRDSRRSASPATSPVSQTHEGPTHRPECTGVPVQQLPAVENLTLHPALNNVDESMEYETTSASVSPPPAQSSGNSTEHPLSPNRPDLKLWQAGPSPYQHRPLTLVNVTGFSGSAKFAVAGGVSGEGRAPLRPVEDDEELSELDSASEAGGSEVASTPYLSAVSTPADTPAAQCEAPSPSKPPPIHKSKSKGNARQLIELQTYSTSILGGQAMMSAKRTRKRESSDLVRSAVEPLLTQQAASSVIPQPSAPPPSKRQKKVPASGSLAVTQDQGEIVR